MRGRIKTIVRSKRSGPGGCKPNIDHKKVARVLHLLSLQTPDECQIWRGYIDRRGYGRIWFKGRWRLAHSVFWELSHKKPLRSDHTLDHYRMNIGEECYKACVNIYHLEPVSVAVNTMRAHGIMATNARKTHCSRGHEFNSENTRLKVGSNGRVHRRCLLCAAIESRTRYILSKDA